MNDNPDFVQSLSRGLLVLATFSANTPEMTLAEMARRSGLTRATARRFLLTLEQLGYVKTNGRRFRLTPRVLELSNAYLDASQLSDIATSHLEELTEKTQLSSSLFALDGTEVVYVARVQTKRLATMSLNVGVRLPALATAPGRVILAHSSDDVVEQVFNETTLEIRTPYSTTDPVKLKEIIHKTKKTGYCISDQELETGICGISVGVFNQEKKVIGAIGLAMATNGATKSSLQQKFVPPLKTIAQRIGHETAF